MGNPAAHRARKRFGQNFLNDQTIIDRILTAFNPQPRQSIVEIGPGQGALTIPLLRRCGELTAIELDRDLIPLLQQRARNLGSLHLINQDVLTIDLGDLDLKPPLRLIGNLPYNISTPLMFHLVKFGDRISDMTFMLQKEVAERILAMPDSKQYGRLTVMMRYHCQADYLLDVPPQSFSPQPKVDSAVVRLRPRKQPAATVEDIDDLDRVVSAAFNQRRKTIANSLKNLVDRDTMMQLGVDPGTRAENLSLEQFALLSRAVHRP